MALKSNGRKAMAVSDVAPALANEPIRPHVEERGEIAILLDGAEMIMRPSYEAIVAFEMSTGKGLLQLTREALGGTLSLPEAAQVVTECVKAWGRATENRSMQAIGAVRIGELIIESPGGYRVALNTLAGLLSMAATGAYTASGELKPATEKTTA